MKPNLIVLAVGLVVILSGCVLPMPNLGGEKAGDVRNDTYTCADGTVVTDLGECEKRVCPVCDDGNPCTIDYCGSDTNYSCRHAPANGTYPGCRTDENCKLAVCISGECVVKNVTNCCGNGVCEEGEKFSSCPLDCTPQCPASCDDANPCTTDYCSEQTGYLCMHQKIDGQQPGCSGKLEGEPCRRRTCSEGTCTIEEIKPCCGNGICESNEDCYSCNEDCKVCYDELKVTVLSPAEQFVFNCKSFNVDFRVNNDHPFVMEITTPDGLGVYDKVTGGACRIKASNIGMCYVVVPAAFGELGENVGDVYVTLEGWESGVKKPTMIYTTRIRTRVTNEIRYYAEDCTHVWCVPGNIATYPVNQTPKYNYTIDGIRTYRGMRMCHATRESANEFYELYFRRSMGTVCLLTTNKETYDVKESCEGITT
ncbi:MAG: hypothetical protein QXP42_02050 [Candidatus Micrarchaeia archaeon]